MGTRERIKFSREGVSILISPHPRGAPPCGPRSEVTAQMLAHTKAAIARLSAELEAVRLGQEQAAAALYDSLVLVEARGQNTA